MEVVPTRTLPGVLRPQGGPGVGSKALFEDSSP